MPETITKEQYLAECAKLRGDKPAVNNDEE